MKKLMPVLLMFLMMFALSACKSETSSTKTSAITTVTTLSESKASQTAACSGKTTSIQSDSGHANISVVTKKANNTEKSNKRTTLTFTTAAKSQSQATTAAKNQCTITIECLQVLKNRSLLKTDKAQYVPDDGYILPKESVTINKNETAYAVLQSVCKAEKIDLNVTNSFTGVYIKGIGNLNEKDCGNSSGWLYSVNGENPPSACDKYTVSMGDNIVFSFVCSY